MVALCQTWSSIPEISTAIGPDQADVLSCAERLEELKVATTAGTNTLGLSLSLLLLFYAFWIMMCLQDCIYPKRCRLSCIHRHDPKMLVDTDIIWQFHMFHGGCGTCCRGKMGYTLSKKAISIGKIVMTPMDFRIHCFQTNPYCIIISKVVTSEENCHWEWEALGLSK